MGKIPVKVFWGHPNERQYEDTVQPGDQTMSRRFKYRMYQEACVEWPAEPQEGQEVKVKCMHYSTPDKMLREYIKVSEVTLEGYVPDLAEVSPESAGYQIHAVAAMAFLIVSAASFKIINGFRDAKLEPVD